MFSLFGLKYLWTVLQVRNPLLLPGIKINHPFHFINFKLNELSQS